MFVAVSSPSFPRVATKLPHSGYSTVPSYAGDTMGGFNSYLRIFVTWSGTLTGLFATSFECGSLCTQVIVFSLLSRSIRGRSIVTVNTALFGFIFVNLSYYHIAIGGFQVVCLLFCKLNESRLSVLGNFFKCRCRLHARLPRTGYFIRASR